MKFQTKKGQTSQMFVYLTTIIVVGLIVFIGGKTLNNVMNVGSEIDYIKFRNALTDTIETIATDYNAQRQVDLTVPKGTKEICFVDLTKNPTLDSSTYPVIINYWSDSSYASQIASSDSIQKELPRNVFLRDASGTIATFHIPDLSVESGALCISASHSVFSFLAKSEGRRVSVSESIH